jgi:hypothetical protein
MLSHGTDTVCADIRESIELHGVLTATVLNPDGSIADERVGENVICTNGYTVLTAALVWAGAQDQAASLGLTTPTTLTPLYGAVGSGTGVPVKSDTTLFTELGRTVVGGAGSTPASSSIAAYATWLFYFPSPASTWTVTEAGAFANATSTAGNGTMIDHWAFSPTLTVSTIQTLIVQISILMGP